MPLVDRDAVLAAIEDAGVPLFDESEAALYAAIRALPSQTAQAGSEARCAFACQWMPNTDPADNRRICANCGRFEPPVQFERSAARREVIGWKASEDGKRMTRVAPDAADANHGQHNVVSSVGYVTPPPAVPVDAVAVIERMRAGWEQRDRGNDEIRVWAADEILAALRAKTQETGR